MKRRTLLLSLFGTLATGAATHAQTAAKPPRLIVQVFLSSACPISNAYAPELSRIQREYAPRGVAFDAVYCADTDEKTVREHAKQFGLTGYRVVPDFAQKRAHAAGIAATPEVAVFDPAKKLRYRGRIDDRYAAIGVRRTKTQNRDLRRALDELLAGKPVSVPRTRAVGCFVPQDNL